MGKRASDDAVARGQAALAAEGITEASLASGAVAPDRLAKILSGDATIAAALAGLLGEVPRPEHAALLAAAEAHTHGAMRREIRRALFRLQRAGIEPPTSIDVAPPAEQLAVVEVEGWLSHVDGRGDCLMWLTRPAPAGLHLLSARLNDRTGLGDLGLYEISRRQLRMQRQDLADRHGIRMTRVEWRYIDARLAAARDARKAGAPSYASLRTRLTDDPPGSTDVPIYRHIPRESIDTALVEASTELLEAPELRSWLPAVTELEAYAREILDAQASPLVLSRHQQDDRMAGIVTRATTELYPVDMIGGRLEAMAYYFWASGRERSARIALAVVEALRSGTTPHAVPLLATLVRQTLLAVYTALRTQTEEQQRTSVIVRPGQPQGRSRAPS
jgi:hypothetical protein